MKFHYGKPTEAMNFADLLQEIPDAEFQNLTRSTIPLLAFLSDQSRVNKLLQILFKKPGITDKPYQTSFEYPVSARCLNCKSKGKASFTDVMIESLTENGRPSKDWLVAIEAKYTEKLYESVGEWLQKGNNTKSDNRKNVMQHWWNLLCTGDCRKPISTPEGIKEVVYQMLHRTASACSMKAEHTLVVHLLFVEEGQTNVSISKINEYNQAITTLRNLIANLDKKPELWLITVNFKKNITEWNNLNDEIKKIEQPEDKAETIVNSLTKLEQLFIFQDPVQVLTTKP